MKGDFARSTFTRVKHYSGLRIQQGRVQVESDANEQADIQTHLAQTTRADVIGSSGAPNHPSWVWKNFQVIPVDGDIAVAPGRIYVGGMLSELDAASTPIQAFSANADAKTVKVESLYLDGRSLKVDDWVEISAEGKDPAYDQVASTDPANLFVKVKKKDLEALFQGAQKPALRRVTTYLTQAEFPTPPAPSGNKSYLVYLDVWQRHLTALEDPEIREVALGGPDTSTRTKTVWQVKILENVACPDLFLQPALAPSTGRLAARTAKPLNPPSLCAIPPSAGYRRLENQLYRVEIHTPGVSPQATYKWSRENGSVVTSADYIDPKHVRVKSLGKDQILGFKTGDFVEVLGDQTELRGAAPGVLTKITDVNVAERILTLQDSVASVSLETHLKVRRWEGTGTVTSNWVALEGGIEARFDAGSYRIGDYWLIPARAATGNPDTGDVEWPKDDTASKNPILQLPQGIPHHYCALAVLKYQANQWSEPHDCRPLFPPTSELNSLFYVSGEGQEAFGGAQLSKPLQVGVSRGQWPVAAAMVRFTVLASSGLIRDSSNNAAPFAAGPIVVKTGVDGLASLDWQLDAAALVQQVEAVLVDDAGKTLHLPIRFTARRSLLEGCEVTVGKNGMFSTLTEALKKLNKSPSICICLLPGEHLFEGPGAAADETIKITGCGSMASRIQILEPLTLQAKEVILKDFGLSIETPTGFLSLTADRVSAEQCRIERGPKGLLDPAALSKKSTLVQVKPRKVNDIVNVRWVGNRMETSSTKINPPQTFEALAITSRKAEGRIEGNDIHGFVSLVGQRIPYPAQLTQDLRNVAPVPKGYLEIAGNVLSYVRTLIGTDPNDPKDIFGTLRIAENTILEKECLLYGGRVMFESNQFPNAKPGDTLALLVGTQVLITGNIAADSGAKVLILGRPSKPQDTTQTIPAANLLPGMNLTTVTVV